MHLPGRGSQGRRSPMKKFILILGLLLSSAAFAKIEVLFHPRDPTLERIAEWISQAKHRVDIAMYNMELGDESPVIKKLKSPEIQKRIQSGDLQIRIIFEGYGGLKGNQEKLDLLENLGLDARFLGKTVKVHHKIAIIDSGTNHQRVVTGSANWSLSSYRGYNENILFLENEPEANYRFQTEFERLWEHCKPFGRDLNIPSQEIKVADQKDLQIYFNSPHHLNLRTDEPMIITDQLVRGIDSAKESLEIATTRIRSEPLLDAVKRAADRGVKVKLLISQDDYRKIDERGSWLYSNPNLQLRIKFYNLKANKYMTYQMHNKFMIVDGKKLFTGSFNWSFSSENLHIENMLELGGSLANEVLPSYKNEFKNLWNLGRDHFKSLEEKLAQEKAKGVIPSCEFAPTALKVPEIKKLLGENLECIQPVPEDPGHDQEGDDQE